MTTIVTKNGSGAPLASDLVQGELAVDLTNKRLYTEDSGGSVIELGSNPTSLTTGTFTSTGIDDNATSTAITIDASENVGIGTASPATKLHVEVAGASSIITNKGTSSNYYGYSGSTLVTQLLSSSTQTYLNSVANLPVIFGTNDTERMRIDASGNVGIGTNSPGAKLHVSGTSGTKALFEKTGSTGAYIGLKDSSGNLVYLGDNNGTFEVQTSGSSYSTKMAITSSGNVGIGTTSPSKKLTVQSATSGDGIYLPNTNNAYPAASTGYTDIRATFIDYATLGQNGGESIIRLGSENAYSTDRTSYIAFLTSSGGTGTSSERMRIDSSGNVLVGRTAPNSTDNTEGAYIFPGGAFVAQRDSASLFLNKFTSDGDIAVFRRQGTTVGSISVTSSATSYNTSSDYRLKENVVNLDNGIDRLKQIPVHRFNFIADPDTTVDGFIAHEVQDVVPEAIIGTKDGMTTEEYEVSPAVLDEEGNVVTEAVMGTREVPEYQGIDQSKLVPLLTAALQEAVAKIEDLEIRLSALEAT